MDSVIRKVVRTNRSNDNQGDGGGLEIDEDDEIIKGTMITRNGEIVHGALRGTSDEASTPESDDSGSDDPESDEKGD